jgi:hemerythrin-like domain-containing protein
MDIYKILSEEHQQVITALEHLKNARVNTRKAIVDQIVDELTAHSMAEDTVLYDRLIDSNKQTVLEAKEEHMIVSRLLEGLKTMRVDDERFEAKVKVLIDVVKHHVEEEEGEMFAQARQVFDDVISESFAGEYVALKAQLQKRPQLLRLGQARLKKAIDDVGHVLRPGT